jgi:hypothetical protein
MAIRRLGAVVPLLVAPDMKRIACLALALAFTGCDLGEEKIWSLKTDAGSRTELRMIHYSDSIEYVGDQDAELPSFGGGEYRVEIADIVLDRNDHVSIHVHESGLYWGDDVLSHREVWIDADITFQPNIDFIDGTLRVATWDDSDTDEERAEKRDGEPSTFAGVAYPTDWCGQNPCDF